MVVNEEEEVKTRFSTSRRFRERIGACTEVEDGTVLHLSTYLRADECPVELIRARGGY